MTTTRSTLQTIGTAYALFEKDQVLTSDQLNSIAAYLEGQQHLDRVLLLGVGIISGLQLTLHKDNSLALGKGFGVATDGDLLALLQDTLFDRYKVYGRVPAALRPLLSRSGRGRPGHAAAAVRTGHHNHDRSPRPAPERLPGEKRPGADRHDGTALPGTLRHGPGFLCHHRLRQPGPGKPHRPQAAAGGEAAGRPAAGRLQHAASGLRPAGCHRYRPPPDHLRHQHPQPAGRAVPVRLRPDPGQAAA